MLLLCAEPVGDEGLPGVDVPPRPTKWLQDRMLISDFRCQVRITGVDSGRITMAACLDPRVPALPQFVSNLVIKQVIGVLVFLIQRTARGMAQDGKSGKPNKHLERLRADPDYMTKWLPRWLEYVRSKGWDFHHAVLPGITSPHPRHHHHHHRRARRGSEEEVGEGIDEQESSLTGMGDDEEEELDEEMLTDSSSSSFGSSSSSGQQQQQRRRKRKRSLSGKFRHAFQQLFRPIARHSSRLRVCRCMSVELSEYELREPAEEQAAGRREEVPVMPAGRPDGHQNNRSLSSFSSSSKSETTLVVATEVVQQEEEDSQQQQLQPLVLGAGLALGYLGLWSLLGPAARVVVGPVGEALLIAGCLHQATRLAMKRGLVVLLEDQPPASTTTSTQGRRSDDDDGLSSCGSLFYPSSALLVLACSLGSSLLAAVLASARTYKVVLREDVDEATWADMAAQGVRATNGLLLLALVLLMLAACHPRLRQAMAGDRRRRP